MPPLPNSVSSSALAEALLTLANSSGVAASLKDGASGQYLWTNDAFLAMMGLNAAHVVGANDADLRPDGCHVGQKPLLQLKFAPSSVLPLPLYLATCGY